MKYFCSLFFYIFVAHCSFSQEIWNVKAVLPNGELIDVKAFDAAGNVFDVKAFVENNNTQFIDVKAIKDGKRLPVKVMPEEKGIYPVKAIDEDGSILSIKAFSSIHVKYDIKGISKTGNIINIKMLDGSKSHYAVKAISPKGILHDIKGVKFSEDKIEDIVHGKAYFAHLKALPQVITASESSIWNIKAIDPSGKTYPLYALSKDGQKFELKAYSVGGDFHLLDVKAQHGKEMMPVKIINTTEPFNPIKAITSKSEILDIKAMDEGGQPMDVKGIMKDGNIIHIKAINKQGQQLGIKAISQAGQFFDVKGIHVSGPKEINGVQYAAHIKAMPQQE